jgi:hypothetical protein
MAHVLNVSMPRSGHHFLEIILGKILGDKFKYCEFYGADCCKMFPCKRGRRKHFTSEFLFMQKSHDFGLDDPISVARTCRVVQYRNPVPRSLSNYELHLRNETEDNIRTFRNFLVNEAWYFCHFYEKWVKDRSRKFLMLTYEDLTADPLKSLLAFFNHVQLPIDINRISEGIEHSVRRRGKENIRFLPSEVFSHRYAAFPVLANFQEIVIRNCPGYFPMRYFSSDDPDNSLLGIIFRAKKAIAAGHHQLAVELAEAARAQDPQDPALTRLCKSARSIPVTPVIVGQERSAEGEAGISFDVGALQSPHSTSNQQLEMRSN